MNNKKINLINLEKIIKSIQINSKKIGLCHGVFDLVHLGHIKHFEYAKKKCDVLIVSVTADEYVNKGPGRPMFDLDKRIEFLSRIDLIDYVIPSYAVTALNSLDATKPKIYFKGEEYKTDEDITGNIEIERNFCIENNIEMVFTSGFTSSSSSIINSNFALNVSQKDFIEKNQVSSKYQQIKNVINQFKNFKVLLIGEPIIDQYSYVNSLGISSKDSVIAVERLKTDSFLGGVFAVANHLSGFNAQVYIPLELNCDSNSFNLINQNLNDGIYFNNISSLKGNSNTEIIIKNRIVDNYRDNRILEIYEHMNLMKIDMFDALKSNIDILLEKISFDLILVTDYGHGLVNSNLIQYLKSLKIPIIANAQSNAGNRGFNSATKYTGVEVITMAFHELQILLQKKDCEEADYFVAWNKLGKPFLIITRGKDGVTMISKSGTLHKCPSFANVVKDRVGAGDALLSMMALTYFSNLDHEINLFLGSIAAALSVKSVANSETLDRVQMLKTLKSILA